MAKRALLVGCNYPGTEAELYGCANDVVRMYQCLVQWYGFMPEDVYVMVDTDSSFPQPTGTNIVAALSIFCQSARPGDTLFFHFSGHGIRLPADPDSNDNTGYDECIVPCDMNLITDDDFRAFVDLIPPGCRLTIVSDSCHSGGLIDGAKEQIGESTKREGFGESSKPVGRERVRDKLRRKVSNSFEKRGIHLPLEKLHRQQHQSTNFQAEPQYNPRGYVINRSLPLAILIKILKQKTGKNDINEENLKLSLFDIFGDNTSPKIKKTMKYIIDRLQNRLSKSGNSGKFLGIVGNLALDFAKQKLGEKVTNPGLSKPVHQDKGILISGCQTDQTSADANPSGIPGESYGVLSNAIQIIIAETNGNVSNQELVLKARKILQSQGHVQRPGLYCGDNHVDCRFVC